MVTKKAPKGREFTLANGKKVRSIEELLNYLRQSSREEYKHHVSEKRNDFAVWIEDVHDRKDLAKALEKSSSRKEAIELLHYAVKEYYEKAMKEVGKELKSKKETVSEEREVIPEHGKFMVHEFIYGLIFGFVLGILAYGILVNLI